MGIGMDTCVVPLKFKGLFLIQTTDYFYPLVDDPYMMGKIACANVLSDIYAVGVTIIDNMLMLLALSTKMNEKERSAVTSLMVQGFKDAAAEAGATVSGGDTIINPWCTIGGVASAVCTLGEFIMPESAVPGDVLVLTKPLGTQVAVTAHSWSNVKWEKVSKLVSKDDIKASYRHAMRSMARLNKIAAQLMHVFGAHGATDITGFGILGHAENLVKNQKHAVSFTIHNLPIISKMAHVAKLCRYTGLLKGTAPETSGGLLICLQRENAEQFCIEFERLEHQRAWVVGTVKEGNRTAKIVDKPNIIEVPFLESDEFL